VGGCGPAPRGRRRRRRRRRRRKKKKKKKKKCHNEWRISEAETRRTLICNV
jgi:hypothetical protein